MIAHSFRAVVPAVFFGGPIFTPAFRAFDNLIAIACFRDATPCLPSFT